MAEISKSKAVNLLTEAERIVHSAISLDEAAIKKVNEICDLVESLDDSELDYRAFGLRKFAEEKRM